VNIITKKLHIPKKRLVIDTTSLISYFDNVFEQGSQISKEALKIIDNAFGSRHETILIIPGVVFVEIFDKWFQGSGREEFQAKFLAEVLSPIIQAPNIEIREIDQEILEKFISLQDIKLNLENRDRLILAIASVLNAPLITSDRKIIRFVKKYKPISEVIY